jgi:tol-pal system protein YbgF
MTVMPIFNTRSASAGLALTLALLGAGGSANAALFGDDEARRAILDLRQKLEQSQTAQKALVEESNQSQAQLNAQLRRSLLDLQTQIDALKADLAKSLGQQERLARDLTELQLRQKDVLLSVDDRLKRFEPVKVTVDGREHLVEPAEKRDFEQAMDVFRQGDFLAAQVALTTFVTRHHNSVYLPSALFWLGNAQYATKSYKESMANFQKMLTLAPNHPRAAESMLAISNVQIELKDLKAARVTLADLVKSYPESETAATARDRLSRLR